MSIYEEQSEDDERAFGSHGLFGLQSEDERTISEWVAYALCLVAIGLCGLLMGV